jgi:hypothetical protein
LKRYLAEFDFRYHNPAKLGINDGERAAKPSRVSRASVSRTVGLTKLRTPKQKARRFLAMEKTQGNEMNDVSHPSEQQDQNVLLRPSQLQGRMQAEDGSEVIG